MAFHSTGDRWNMGKLHKGNSRRCEWQCLTSESQHRKGDAVQTSWWYACSHRGLQRAAPRGEQFYFILAVLWTIFHAAQWALSTLRRAPPWREPREAQPDSLQGKVVYAPPPSPFWARKEFWGGGGGGCIFWTPRGRNFIRPPSFIHPPPLEGSFQGWGGGGCIKFGPVFSHCRNPLRYICDDAKSLAICEAAMLLRDWMGWCQKRGLLQLS